MKDTQAALTRAQSIAGDSVGRLEGDFYPTPRGATLALLGVENFVHTDGNLLVGREIFLGC